VMGRKKGVRLRLLVVTGVKYCFLHAACRLQTAACL
jgi:hypothetical protein